MGKALATTTGHGIGLEIHEGQQQFRNEEELVVTMLSQMNLHLYSKSW